DPAATLTIHLKSADGKAAEHTLKPGKQTGDAPASLDRFAMVDKSDTVIVVPGTLAQRLTAAPLQWRDRDIASLTAVDRLVLQRGPRKAAFAKVDGTWKMTEPITTDAEPADLDDFVHLLNHL